MAPLPLDNPLTPRAYNELQKAQSLIAQGVQLCAVIREYGGNCDDLIQRLDENRTIVENMKRVLFPDKP